MDFGRKKSQVPVSEWLKLVLAFFLSNVINNAIFNYKIAVPLYTVFRSGSLAASLIAEKAMLSRTHSAQKHLSVMFITAGIIICTYQSGKELNNTASFKEWCVGIVLLLTSLILSSSIGVNQERIYSRWGKHYLECLFFTHFLPLPGFLLLHEDIYSHLIKIVQSRMVTMPSMSSLQIPCMVLYLVGNISCQYFCAKSISKLSSQFSSLTITCILTLRKFFSILISVWIFDNAFTALHWIGTATVFIGILLFAEIPTKQTKQGENKKEL